MQKGHKKQDIFNIAEDFFDDEFFSPSLPFTDISRVQIPKPKIKKFDIDEEFDTKEDNLKKKPINSITKLNFIEDNEEKENKTRKSKKALIKLIEENE